MPHQCLSCGETFQDGSTDLLKGCPSCEGTRFFFTQEPLDEQERAELKDKAEKDVHQMLQDLVKNPEKRNFNDNIWSRDAWEKWVRLEASGEVQDVEDLAKGKGRKLTDAGPLTEPSGEQTTAPSLEEVHETLQVKLDDVQEVQPPEPEPGPQADEEEAPELSAPEADQDTEFELTPAKDVRPSTLTIREPGNYEIDVERLMEDSPVIVERDGSYVIHLPSVFEGKKKR